MRVVLLAAALLVASAFASFFHHPSAVNRAVPRLRDQAASDRSPANYLFGQLQYAVMTKNMTAASALLDDNIESIITGVSCTPMTNKTQLLAVLGQFFEVLDTVGLQSKYHIVSERWGAFQVQDWGINAAKYRPQAGWSFFVNNVMFIVRVTEAGDKIDRFYEYFPTGETEAGRKQIQALKDFMNAMSMGDAKAVASYFNEASVMTNLLEGPYPAMVFNYSNILSHLVGALKTQQRRQLILDVAYESCGQLIAEVSELIENVIPDKTNPTTLQTVAVKQMCVQSWTNTSDGHPIIEQWYRFFWQLGNEKPVSACTIATDCSNHAMSVTGNTGSGCDCLCAHRWTGPQCEVCPQIYDPTQDCATCAPGYTGYPDCHKSA